MRFSDLRLPELLQFDAEGGTLRFAEDRALLVSAEALSMFNRQVSDKLGEKVAREISIQFGFAQGWSTACALQESFQWGSDEDWQGAGGHLGKLTGLFDGAEALSKALLPGGVQLFGSWEAAQHLEHRGAAPRCTCSFLSGFVSGYLSRTEGHTVVAVEDDCQACGAVACRFLAQPRQEWSSNRHDLEPTQLQECLDAIPAGERGTKRPVAHGTPRPVSTVPPPSAADKETSGIVSDSPSMRATVQLASRLAEVDSTVLITGESGTGKERIARIIHQLSARRHRPFIAVNCGAISEGLLESELFGHARGSFTGAIQAHTGMFEAANHGTILLDEIGEISASMQVKLLRVLQEREVRRVGEETSRAVDFRVLAATNKDLAEQVELGRFRQDLYYRIRVVELPIPALRDRPEDILPLARALLETSATRMKRRVIGLSPTVVEKLQQHQWPGNVRELENAMERAVALARGARIELEDLPDEVIDPSKTSSGRLHSVRPLQDVSKDYILAALSHNQGNQVHTAQQLGIGTATLYRKLKSYGYTTAGGLARELPELAPEASS